MSEWVRVSEDDGLVYRTRASPSVRGLRVCVARLPARVSGFCVVSHTHTLSLCRSSLSPPPYLVRHIFSVPLYVSLFFSLTLFFLSLSLSLSRFFLSLLLSLCLSLSFFLSSEWFNPELHARHTYTLVLSPQSHFPVRCPLSRGPACSRSRPATVLPRTTAAATAWGAHAGISDPTQPLAGFDSTKWDPRLPAWAPIDSGVQAAADRGGSSPFSPSFF